MTANHPQERGHLPYLQDLVTAISAPTMALSNPDGQLPGSGASGCYLADRRAVSRLVVTVNGREPGSLQGQPVGATRARFVSVARNLGDLGPDPSVLVERDRTVSGTGIRELITVVSHARDPVDCTLAVTLASDLADIHAVKAGTPTAPLPGDVRSGGARWTGPDGTTVVATLTPAADTVISDGSFEWAASIAPQGSWSATIDVTIVDDPLPAVILPASRSVRSPDVQAGDHRMPALVAQSVADLNALLVADPLAPADNLLAAGAPWYLTMFGRDSIWAARMLLPLGTDVAAGTLRSLARRQGKRHDPEAAEAPGKILHEVRRAAVDHGAWARSGRHLALPPLYYGSVDATPLWISLLHDAWRWGMPDAEVAQLIPQLEVALGWLRDDAVGESGFVQYVDESGHGLANQGWKDSVDAVQFSDGTLAKPPIALCEAQGYAHAAALDGADVLDAFDRPGGEFWRDWAGQLHARFRDRFWVDDLAGGYPAIALDGSGRPVDTVTSNIGHLLGTGLLDADEVDQVVQRLAAPDMDCGFGLRTMSSLARGFNPLSYHCGSVWAHDTAIAIHGLAGVGSEAARSAVASLVRGLLAVAPAFGFRLPELHGGEATQDGGVPLPYPAACRPQAWSAAAAVAILSAVLGLDADAPNGKLVLHPLRPSPVGELTVRGLQVGGAPLDVQLNAAGELSVLSAPAGLRVDLAVDP